MRQRGQLEPWKTGNGEGRSDSAGEELMVARIRLIFVFLACREALLAEMGVAVREDGGTVGVFSPKKVSEWLGEEA